MSIPNATPTAAWKAVSPQDRREVFLLAKSGTPHPDAEVADAAYALAHSDVWDRIWNRVPGWLLPVVGLVFLLLSLALGTALGAPAFFFLVFPVAFGVVILLGLLGWQVRSEAAQLRRVYPRQ